MTKAIRQKTSDRIDAEHRKTIWAHLRRITIYYVCLAAVVSGILVLFPSLMGLLPVGGIAEYQASQVRSAADAALAAAAPAPTSTWFGESISLFLAMLCSLALMVPVAWLYKAIHTGQEFDHSIDETTLVMPAVVAGVVTVAQHSLALAFSLAGIVAGVRFRRALSDTFDTLFIFVAIGVGLAAGVGAIEVAAVITVFFSYTTAFTSIFGDGLESRYAAKKQSEEDKRRRKAKRAARPEKVKEVDPLAAE
ncbi:MAG: DUF4956 domain-containing protein [Pseudomonadota bacterium]